MMGGFSNNLWQQSLNGWGAGQGGMPAWNSPHVNNAMRGYGSNFTMESKTPFGRTRNMIHSAFPQVNTGAMQNWFAPQQNQMKHNPYGQFQPFHGNYGGMPHQNFGSQMWGWGQPQTQNWFAPQQQLYNRYAAPYRSPGFWMGGGWTLPQQQYGA